jgi:hypothetical protein
MMVEPALIRKFKSILLYFTGHRGLVLLFVGATLSISLTKFAWNWPHIWDIPLWDETFYMGRGLYTWDGNFGSYESSVLYSYIYHAMHFFIESPIALINVTGLFGIIIAISCIFAATLITSRSIFFATLSVSFLLMSQFLLVSPKLIYPAIAILMIGGAISLSCQVLFVRSSILALTTFIVSFIRPEFVVACYCFSLLFLVSGLYALVYRGKQLTRSHPREIALAFVCMIFFVVLSLAWTFPIIKGGDRALQAFGQHYALYWVQVNNVDINPFLNWQRIIAQEFPGAKSGAQAMLQAPSKILSFFSFNIRLLVTSAYDVALNFLRNHALYVVIASGLMIIGLLPQFKEGSSGKDKEYFPPIYHDFLIIGILLLPICVSVIVIYPRPHYIMIGVSLFVLALSRFVRRYKLAVPGLNSALLAVLSLIWISPAETVPLPHLDVITALQNQPKLGQLLELDGGWCFYLPSQCVSQFAIDIPQGTDFLNYVNESGIDAILVSDELRRYAGTNHQAAFLSLITSPQPAGWSRVVLTPGAILLRRTGNERAFLPNMLSADMRTFMENIHLGDKFGVVQDLGNMRLFIHPGLSTLTTLDLNVGKLRHFTGCKEIQIECGMDKRVPQEAVDRGAAVVDFSVSYRSELLFSKIIHVGSVCTFPVDFHDDLLGISVGNHGNPDTDWFNLNINLSNCD